MGMRCRGPTGVLGKEGWVWEERGSPAPAALGCSELTRPGEDDRHVPSYGWAKTWVFGAAAMAAFSSFLLGNIPKLAFPSALPFPSLS